MLLIRNIGALLTLRKASREQGRRPVESSLSIAKNQAIAVEAGKVAWVGKNNSVPVKYLKAKEVDLGGRTVLPAFVECHTHLVFGGQRSDEFELRNTGVSYQEITRRGGGIASTVKATRKLSEDELYNLAQERVRRFIAQGVTTVEVKSGYALRFKDELKMLKVARRLKDVSVVTSYLGPHSVPKEHSSAESYMKTILSRDLKKVADSGLADRVDIFIEKGFFSLAQGKAYLEKAQSLGLGATIHADQLSRTGASVLGAELGASSVDHAVEVSAADIRKLAKSDTTAVLLPTADYYLKMKYPKARKLIDAGAKVALATDFNPGSSPTQDLATVGLMARLEMKMSLPETIVAYTLNAASALAKEDVVGSIEVGKQADFAVLDDDWTQLFYSMGRTPIHSTYRKGRAIFKAS